MRLNINEEIDRYLDDFLNSEDTTIENTISIYNRLNNISENLALINEENLKIKQVLNEQIQATKELVNVNRTCTILSNMIDEKNLNDRIQKVREKNLVLGVINLLDSVEWLLNMSMIFSNEGLKETINTSKIIMKKELDNMKILSTANVGELFNDNLHSCVGYKENENMFENQILSVVKRGYKYRDEIIRLAEVIVVKNN